MPFDPTPWLITCKLFFLPFFLPFSIYLGETLSIGAHTQLRFVKNFNQIFGLLFGVNQRLAILRLSSLTKVQQTVTNHTPD